MVMGAVMLGGIITGKPPVNLSQATPIARLTSEYNVFVLPANSPLKTMDDVVEQLKKDPGSVKWGGGSRGSTEHIAAAMIAREGRRRPVQDQLRRLPRRRRSHGGHPGRQRHGRRQRLQRVRRVHRRPARCGPSPSPRGTRLKGINVPTLKEQGIDVEIGNWRGVYGAPGITAAQRKALTDMVLAALKTKSWAEALEKNDWTPAVLTRRGVRQVRRRRLRQPARHHGQVRHGLTAGARPQRRRPARPGAFFVQSCRRQQHDTTRNSAATRLQTAGRRRRAAARRWRWPAGALSAFPRPPAMAASAPTSCPGWWRSR